MRITGCDKKRRTRPILKKMCMSLCAPHLIMIPLPVYYEPPSVSGGTSEALQLAFLSDLLLVPPLLLSSAPSLPCARGLTVSGARACRRLSFDVASPRPTSSSAAGCTCMWKSLLQLPQ